ncbi:hypothetical protein D3C71_1912380 [compost metagenome]
MLVQCLAPALQARILRPWQVPGVLPLARQLRSDQGTQGGVVGAVVIGHGAIEFNDQFAQQR